MWEWQRDDGGYSPYPPETSAQVERAYCSGAASHAMTDVDYTVHFSTMTQQKNSTGERVHGLVDGLGGVVGFDVSFKGG